MHQVSEGKHASIDKEKKEGRVGFFTSFFFFFLRESSSGPMLEVSEPLGVEGR